ncbi:DUF2059 domain-containing protein [Bradyrhizobium arachidis]|uniref:DUF2059 domain-containing protein n=1 Tax=Bradyrhizobium TaxID=374 RepID=UPI0021616EA5|nr:MULTISPECIES: DUF2059 domain-containing protein [Bradyrhizobium]MDN4982940.1 DUF2059 domain-containing protein [Bradyrhizobium sp. WYCCWR 13022]UVO34413.1 DUF2059 domain-containing protein [Bradyrhizobium arachidis]
MKSVSKIVPAVCLAFALALGAVPATAQQQPAPQAPSPGAIAAAKEILQLKNAAGMYANAVPAIVDKVKTTLIGQNLNYQKDLNELAPVIAKQLAGREQEIGEGMVGVYAGEFTEQELKDLVTFYKSPLGQKLIANEPKAINLSVQVMNDWARNFSEVVASAFRAEMKKRGKEI